MKEAARAAAVVSGEYTCLKEKDLAVFHDGPTLKKVMELVRRLNPFLVLTHSPSDYMVDHETTSSLCQAACFGACAPNYLTGAKKPAKAMRATPTLLYAQPFGGRDILGNRVRPRLYVNIASTLERKETALACHESQQAWLKTQQGIPGPVDVMTQTARELGAAVGFPFAEGFRQHLGQGFPQENLLKDILGDLVSHIDP
jgi:N-acetylglucosamine malate deacetylase 1